MKELGEVAIEKMEKLITVFKVRGCSLRGDLLHEIMAVIDEYKREKKEIVNG